MIGSNPSRRKNLLISIGAGVLLLNFCLPVHAAPKTVTLSIPSMDCPVCPITVKKVLSRVSGVSHATVSFDRRQAVVTFDDSVTHVGALTDATKNAGYPSTLAGPAN